MSPSFSTPWDINNIQPPWGDRPSIHDHIKAHLNPNGPGLLPGGEELPDDEIIHGRNGIRWAPGAEDGVFGHHFGGGKERKEAAKIFNALMVLALGAKPRHAHALYKLLTTQGTLARIDPLLALIRQRRRPDPHRLRAIARWLATKASDREPVKAGIALLGLFPGQEDREIFLALGRHEEFTLYAAVALANTEEDPEPFLWELAHHVTGWGRIQIIERLAETKNEQIKAWLLREGCRNSVMNEYTALICARTGDLPRALRSPDPDEALLAGASVILEALIPGGGPTEGIESYPEGAETAQLYLSHLARRETNVAGFLTVHAIKRFLEEDERAQDPALGWPERRKTILGLIEAILARPDWVDKIRRDLESPDPKVFYPATAAAGKIGLDAWEVYLIRAAKGESLWHLLMQTDDPERMDRALQLASEHLPLAVIASGPADEIGLGREFTPHGELDWILQRLGAFPGKGWPFIKAGLRSPVTRNRNLALRALAEWGKERWPEETEGVLAAAARLEPDAEVRRIMRCVLKGQACKETGYRFGKG